MELNKLSAYDFSLPKKLIAQRPAEPRDSSRLMVVKDNEIEHRIFREIINYMRSGDLMVVNDTRVIKARIFGRKPTGGKVEILLAERVEENVWKCLLRGKKIREGLKIKIGDVECCVMGRDDNFFVVKFPENPLSIAERYGEMPVPPYIKEPLKKDEEYQTVYARKEGAIAAPTAGLHFTRELLSEIERKGVRILHITLHVGYGTFSPVKTEDITKHRMHAEYYEISEEVAEEINSRDRDSRVFAVGTTTLRALESSSQNGKIIPSSGFTDLFIYPGYRFRSPVNALITNFHLPKSTLIMLVCAFGGYERIMRAYRIAIEKKYRFFSFGDAMLIFR